LIKDLHQQNAQFATWRQSLDKLMKRGLPDEFIDELRAMGPEEGQALIDNILGAKPAQVQKLIGEWKRKNAQIKQATKMDFTQEINQFKKAGGDMGKAIIEGFQSAQVGLWFDGWVKGTFPGVINSAVNQAISDWRKTNPPPVKPPPPPVKPRVPTSTTGGSVTNDNSRNITVTMPGHDSSATAIAMNNAEVRRRAFILASKLKSVLGTN